MKLNNAEKLNTYFRKSKERKENIDFAAYVCAVAKTKQII